MEYKGHERSTGLPLDEEMISQLAMEAEIRGMRIGELVAALILEIVKKDLFQPIRDHATCSHVQTAEDTLPASTESPIDGSVWKIARTVGQKIVHKNSRWRAIRVLSSGPRRKAPPKLAARRADSFSLGAITGRTLGELPLPRPFAASWPGDGFHIEPRSAVSAAVSMANSAQSSKLALHVLWPIRRVE
jgi:hypothetical protein